MKVAMWANSPSPHQSDFYAALRRRGIDLRALYLEHLRPARRSLGWAEPSRLPPGEFVLPPHGDPLHAVTDWHERIHVIPGYSRRLHRLLAVRLSRAGVPWVHWSESSRPVWRAALTWTIKRWYARWVNRAALGALAQGDLAERDFRRWGIRRQKIEHLYYSVQGVPAGTRPDPTTSRFVDGKFAFVFSGSLCRRKGCDVLLRAFARAAADAPHAVLVLVGDGPLRPRLRRQADTLGIADRVLFRGVVPMAEIGSVLVCCQALVLPSHFDGWGMALNEGASAGLALIATDRVGAAWHLIEPGWNGLVVKAGDLWSLTNALREHALDSPLAALRGRRSRRRYQQFTPEASSQRFLAAVHQWLTGDDRWAKWSGYEHWFDASRTFSEPAAA